MKRLMAVAAVLAFMQMPGGPARADSQILSGFIDLLQNNHAPFICLRSGKHMDLLSVTGVQTSIGDGLYLTLLEQTARVRASGIRIDVTQLSTLMSVIERSCEPGTMFRVQVRCPSQCYCVFDASDLDGDLASAVPCDTDGNRTGRYWFEFADRDSAESGLRMLQSIASGAR